MSATAENSKYNIAVKQFKLFLISEELLITKGNICKAAIGLGIHRNTINKLIAEMKIDIPQIKRLARDIK